MKNFLVSLVLVAFFSVAGAQDVVYHHDLEVSIDPETSRLEVTDTIAVPGSRSSSEMEFTLHEDLVPEILNAGARIEQVGKATGAPNRGMDKEDYTDTLRIKKYRIVFDGGDAPEKLRLSYAGKVNHPVKQANEEYSRGFSQSPGLIEPRGVYLAGSTHWLPGFNDEYVTYEMTVKLPAGWRSVSQGNRTAAEDGAGVRTDTWLVDTPTEEIFIIAAEFHEYEYGMGRASAMAFLRDSDEALANRYLEATAGYMEMYRRLVGPYPYSKFALVENFWETGYGMPSFTLLGPQIIRFPFILHSSYPHELLHNWWGNGVFVDFDTGNWCEGLTAYMADHLIAEQRGEGADYRRDILQDYSDYVTPENEFPLSDFHSRYDAPSSSIGYGKNAMMWDMLRERIGDDNFIRAFQQFYRENKFRRAGYSEIRKSFEDVTGEDLAAFFEQWVERVGAPELVISHAEATEKGGQNGLTLELAQIQKGDLFDLSVPVVIYGAETIERRNMDISGKKQRHSFELDFQPLRVEVDPDFNVMRRLDYREVPPTLSSMFGAGKTLMILPSDVPEDEQAMYRQLAETWKGRRGDEFQVRLDSEVDELPADASVWILGWGNRWQKAIEEGLDNYDAEISRKAVRFGEASHSTGDNSFVIALRHTGNTDLAVSWLSVHDAAAVPELARRLPHYGKYSYLGFTGPEASNFEKGQWPPFDSPLAADLHDYTQPLPERKSRQALAEVPPVFDARRMEEDVNVLADESMEGRGIGTAGLDAAADYIADQFREAGLEPAGDDGSYFQSFEVDDENGNKVTVRNVLAAIPGSNSNWSSQSVVVSAHYDHLGYGWPDVKSGNKGKIHYGADDNASGVAVLLDLARAFSSEVKQQPRSIVFAAFTAEEAGSLGARHYIENARQYPADQVIGNLNMDTVGRLGDNKVLILGSSSAKEWPFIFMGASAVTGVETQIVTQEIDASDHVAFVEAGVPGIQFFSGFSPDYHQPTDTADKLDFNGMVKVAAIVREGIEYLSQREDELEFSGGARQADSGRDQQAQAGERRASTGVMPDFTFNGTGVAVGDVVEGTPAQKAGLTSGDVITAINDTKTDNLQIYSDLLKQFSPEEVIDVTFMRDGVEKQVRLELIAR